MISKTFLKSGWLALLGICFFTAVSAQNKVYHEVFTSRNGLAINYIEDLIQDQSGYLWIAGRNVDHREIINKSDLISLQRFDGDNFNSIKIEDDQGYLGINKMISFNDHSLLFHSKGRRENNHLISFNPITSQNVVLKTPQLKFISNLRMINGIYYALNSRGSTVDVYTTQDAQDFKLAFSMDNQVNAVNVDGNTTFVALKDLFVFSDNNFPITITDHKGKLIKKFSYDIFNRSRDVLSSKLWIEEAFVQNEKLYVFMSGDDRLHLFNQNTLEFEPLNIKVFQGKSGLKTFTDASGNVLISFYKEKQLYLTTLNEKEQIEVLFNHDTPEATTIQIWSKDLKDEVWVAAAGELHYYKFPNDQFEKHLLEKELRAIVPIDSNQYMVATEKNGWYTYDYKKKEINPFPIIENGTSITLSSSRNILIDKDTLWSNSLGNILAIHKENGGSRAYRHFPIQAMEALNDSLLIYGTNKYGLIQFNKKDKSHHVLVKTDSLKLIDIAIDHKKKWIVSATQKGVFTYNILTQESRLLQDLVESDYFLMIDYDKNYGFLIGSRDGTILQFNPENGFFKTLYQDDLKAGIATIVPYKNDLWINTFNGLVHFNSQTKKTNRYSTKDGLSHNEGNRYSAALTKDGILMGSLSGFNYFIPENLISQQSSDSLQLLKIRKYDKKLDRYVEIYDQSAFAKAEHIKLPTENKQLELNFSLTGLDVLRKESYEYQLNDEEWVNLGEEKSLQFLNLAAGSYNLKIRAKDFSGNLISKPIVLSIISEDFFYNKWWFYVIVALLLTSILLWFLREERIKSNMQVQFTQDLIENQEKERSRIAKELHDSVGQQLTLIKRTAQNENLNHISGLTNTTLEEIRSISRNLYPANLYRLGFKASVEQLLEEVDDQTSLFVDVEIDDVDAFLDQKSTLNLYRFIQEAVSNVMKHAQAKTLQLQIIEQGLDLSVHIKDNGKGFHDTQALKNNSLGLKTLQERIKIISGTLEIQSAPGKGTELIAIIPKIK